MEMKVYSIDLMLLAKHLAEKSKVSFDDTELGPISLLIQFLTPPA
jgi:hypothetical protein